MAILVEKAAPADLELVLEIADEAARWLLARNIRQWESPPSPEIRELLRCGIEAGDVYLVRLEGSPEAIGTFRMEWTGAPLWPGEKNAGYLYSLGLRPRFIGLGIGAGILSWVAQWLAAQGREWLRLDCIAANTRLRRWYAGLGFHDCGIGTIAGHVLALYELELPAVLGSKREYGS